MMYPTMVLIFATLVLIGLLMFLVPVFVNIFAQLNGELPTLTQMVVAASDQLRHHWFIIFPASFGIIWGVRRSRRPSPAASSGTGLKLKIPMKIGDVVLKVTMARFSRTLSTLVAAGVDIIKALEITGQTAGNWVIEEALADVRQKVHQGVPIAQPLIENPVFPPMVSQMVKIGEETGELEKMLGEDRRLLRGRGRLGDRLADRDHRAADDDRRGRHGRRDHHRMYLPMFKLLSLVK